MTRRRDRRRSHVLLVIENVPFARDHRARKQADALSRAGRRVTVLTQRDPENARFASGRVRVVQYPAPRQASGAVGYLLEYAWSLAAWVVLAARQYARDPFGAIQIGQPPDVSPVLALPFRLLGVRYVGTQRMLPRALRGPFRRPNWSPPRILRILERRSWRLADRVLCVNESLREAIIGRGGVDPAKVTIVANGPVLVRVAGCAARSECARRREAPRVLGRGDGRTGSFPDLLLQAAADMVHRLGRRDVRFAFIGDGNRSVMRRRSRVGSGSRGGSRSPVGSTKRDASPTSQRRTSGSTPTSKRRCPG